MTDPPLKQGWNLHDPPPSKNKDVWFPLNNPIKPCSLRPDKICWYTATTNINKITEILPFTEKTNVKNRLFLVSMDVMSLDTNIQQNKGILKLSVTKHMKTSTKTTHSYTLLAGNAKSSKKIASTSMESTTYKTMELQWARRQQFWFLCQYFHDIYSNNNSKQNCL